MDARVGVMVLIVSVKAVAAKMPAMPIPTPMIPVSSGIPAAISEPKVTRRITAATAMPMSSPMALISDIWKAFPEYAMVRSPSCPATTSAKASRSSASMSMVVSAANRTWTVPVVSSALSGLRAAMSASICSCGISWAALASVSCWDSPSAAITGLTIASVSARKSSSRTCARNASTSSVTAGSVRVLPSGARMTTVPVGASSWSPAPANRSCISSWVSIDSRPGIEKVVLVCCDIVAAAVPTPTINSIQAAMNRHLNR